MGEVMELLKYVTIPMMEKGVRLDMDKLVRSKADIQADIVRLQADIKYSLQDIIRGQFNVWFMNKEYPYKATGKIAKLMKKGPMTLEQAQQYLFWEDYPEAGWLGAFNLQSKHHLKKLFFEYLKEEPLSRTPTGLPQVDDEFIQSVHDKYEWCKNLTKYNKLCKLKSAYIDRFIEESEDGRLYPSFMQHRTVSGRYGSDIQQMPRPVEPGGPTDIVARYTNLVREFILPDEDCVLISADYEQLEPTVFAHVSGDASLSSIFHAGKDFYSEVAIKTERLAGASSDKTADNYLAKTNKEKRQRAKSYALGIAYGMTGYKLQFEIGVSQEEAEQLVKDYLTAFPDLARWMNESKDKARSAGYIKSQAGRMRRLRALPQLFANYGARITDSLRLWKDFHDMPEVYQRAREDYKTYKNLQNNAINFQIQSLAASIINRAAIKLARLFGLVPSMQIHDELVYNIEDKEGVKTCTVDKLKNTMQNVVSLSVPLRTEPKIGKNFRECK